MYSLHEMGDYRGSGDFTYEQARKRFYRLGCGAFDAGSVKCDRGDDVRYDNGPAVDMLQDLLGDDVDGLAATLEDFGL
jgi:hypothetical protein